MLDEQPHHLLLEMVCYYLFWKEKDLVKKQIKVLPLEKLEDLLLKSNDLELSIKKNPSISTNILTNFILEEVA